MKPSFVPQLPLLERAAVFVTHGGMNSANEGLYYGVPLIVVRGAAMSIEATPARLREPASTVLSDPAFRANAAKLGTNIKWAGDHRRAADKVARFAGA